MGCGSWSASSFDNYTRATKSMSVASYCSASGLNAQDIYKVKKLSDKLNPFNIMRECVDTEEHPNTIPVILALDVTGSMGSSAIKVSQKLGEIMTELYDTIPDVEFCIMGIGDLAYDSTPIQMSQFESDIRIAEQLDELYMEFGGGGNVYESYTAAWYMGSRHTKLDCWNRGKKGIIITMGDELPNPYLPRNGGAWNPTFKEITGDTLQDNISTKDLYKEVIEKFDIYHLSVDDNDSSYRWNNRHHQVDSAWEEMLGDNYKVVTLDNLASTIVNIISNAGSNMASSVDFTTDIKTNEKDEISW